MLRKDLAAKFVERLADNLKYNINVMDASGTIIASSDPARVGTFHESAYRIITGKLDIARIHANEPKPKGTRPGVNLPIHHDGAVIGVVGVTGDPDEVLSLAHAIKTSLETMIDFELYKDHIFMRQNRKNLFLNLVLYERSRELRAIQEAAKSVDYSEACFRAPIIFVFENPASAPAFLELLKHGPFHTKQDISCVTLDQDILVFKSFKTEESEVLSRYRQQVREYVEAASKLKGVKALGPFSAYAGPRVRGFLNYSPAYEQARWLIGAAPPPRKALTFFDDHVEDFLISKIPRLELHEVFAETLDCFKSEKHGPLLETLRVIFAEDRNLQRAAARLGVHRNTVYQRLQKAKALLGIDPLEHAAYTKYFYLLAKYAGTEA
jgi:carbohydrate diacid regulator